LQAIRYKQHRIPQTHGLITDHLDVTPVNGIFGRVTVRDIALHEIAKNEEARPPEKASFQPREIGPTTPEGQGT
jgi:hypothetical protein